MSRSRGATSSTTRSPIRMLPELSASRPASIRSAVVLPEPEGPTSTMNSPSSIASDSSDTAVVSPKRFVTRSNVTLAISALALHRAREHAADEVTLEEDVDDDDGSRDDHRAGGEQRQVGRVLPLEEREPERRRAQVLVGDHHEREQELVPRPHEDEHHHREDRGPPERDKHAPECRPTRGAVDACGFEQR